MFKMTGLLTFLAGIGISASIDYYMMLPFMLMSGFAIAGEIAVGLTIINEYLPASKS